MYLKGGLGRQGLAYRWASSLPSNCLLCKLGPLEIRTESCESREFLGWAGFGTWPIVFPEETWAHVLSPPSHSGVHLSHTNRNSIGRKDEEEEDSDLNSSPPVSPSWLVPFPTTEVVAPDGDKKGRATVWGVGNSLSLFHSLSSNMPKSSFSMCFLTLPVW